MTPFERAKQADARARDMIAIALDRYLAAAPLVRGAASRFLTRPMARTDTSYRVVAGEMGWNVGALKMAVARSGGSSLDELRKQMMLVRLAALFEHDNPTWALAAEVLNADEDTLTRTVCRFAASAKEWRARARLSQQFNALEEMLARNATAWATTTLRPRLQGFANGNRATRQGNAA